MFTRSGLHLFPDYLLDVLKVRSFFQILINFVHDSKSAYDTTLKQEKHSGSNPITRQH